VTNWNQIVREHGPPTYRAAWRILRHPQDCEDVLQEVFIEAHELFVRGEILHPRTFLNRLVTFRAIDLLRRRRVTDSINNSPARDSSLQDPTAGPEATAINHEETLRLRSIVADLPPRQAAVFCLVHFEELSHDEVASTLEISTGAVAMALHKARAKLREVFDALKESGR
jgi:RNA polymerase sigma-70 factor, ECF subfamily